MVDRMAASRGTISPEQGVCNSRFQGPLFWHQSICVSRLFDRMTRTTQTAAIVNVASYAATFGDGVFLRTVDKSIQIHWKRSDLVPQRRWLDVAACGASRRHRCHPPFVSRGRVQPSLLHPRVRQAAVDDIGNKGSS